ncbi:MAG: TRAP transporter substrate-binding protein [Comamonadaceae bacterium]|nr:MAG: TRAP transporter substrate-binding protein [Comamonadaceae bacterium]
MTPTTRTTLRAIAAGAMLCAALGAQAQDKPVELKFAHWLPQTHPLAKLGFEPWAKSVEAASKGTIKIAFFPAQQLGKAADHYDMARDGIADITWANPGYQGGRFPIIAAAELPFLVAKPGGGSAAVDAWYRKYAATEMKDVKYCFAHLHVGTMHSKKPISEPSQIKGMKIRSSNGTNAAYMSLLGGTNVQVSAPEARDALDKGVADALAFPWGSIITFGIDKATKFHSDMRMYASAFVWTVNKPWYDKLSTAQKKVIDDHCNNDWAGRVGAAWGDEEDSGQGKMEKMEGHTIVKVSPAQLDLWKKAAAPLYGEWEASVAKVGVNGKQALADLHKELDGRKAGN